MFGFEGSEIDLKEIALKIAKEPAIKDDGTPLIANGKEVSKIEKVMREWATSGNPELQKRFVDIVNKEEKLDDASVEALVYLLILACKGTDEIRAGILEKMEKWEKSDFLEDSISQAKQTADSAKRKHSGVVVYIPENGR